MALTVASCRSVESVDWSQLDTILLDMDGTLLDLEFDNHFWGTVIPGEWGRQRGLDVATSQETLAPLFAAQRGRLNWYCIDFWAETLELDIPNIKADYSHGIRWRPKAERFMQHLKASHLDVVMITNAHPLTLEMKAERLPLAEWFDAMISSHDYGTPKETADFWDRLMAERPFDPERTLFVDDSEHVLEAAETYGVAHLMTLRQPDSTIPPRQNTRYPAILHFDEIFSGLPTLA
jgi:HAD superfamily hydrolase (TIGR01509 family)